MKKTETPLPGLFIIEPEVYADQRGWFFESYNKETFQQIGLNVEFVQDNHSQSKKGVLRGLHFQKDPYPMAKLVRCTAGRVWDVAVDLRPDSKTRFGWSGLELSAENKKMLFLPEGFAHGFYALTDCELQYKVSHVFVKEFDAGVLWSDPQIAVEWPLEGNPLLSQKDQALPKFVDL